MNLILAFSAIVLFHINDPMETPENRGLSLLSGRVSASQFVAIASPAPKEKEEKNQEKNQGNKKEDLLVSIVPLPNDWNDNAGYYSLPEQGTFYAGELFAVAIVVTGENNQIVDANGSFRFKWSSHNYIDPSKPKHQKKPVDTNWNYVIQNGVCLIRNVQYGECGIIQLTGMIQVRVGNNKNTDVVHGASNHLKFHPHHYELRISQKPANQGDEASYTYSGQPFSAEITVTALNGYNPPETIQNYDGQLASEGNHSLGISIKSPYDPSIKLTYPAPSIVFNEGAARIEINSMKVSFETLLNPQNLLFQYRVQDINKREGSGTGSSMEFRCGQIRIHDCISMTGSSKRIFIDINEYRDERWQLNTQEESIQISSIDLSIDSIAGNDTPVISGGPVTLFGGKVRGGETPLVIQASGFNSDVSFEIRLVENSGLSFLYPIPGQWILYQQLSIQNRLGYLLNNRVLYEKERE